VNTESKKELIAYGRALMARVAGGKAQGDPSWSDAFVKLLNPTPAVGTAKGPLRCIFRLPLKPRLGGQSVTKFFVQGCPARALCPLLR
jgi:hypothetical protein